MPRPSAKPAIAFALSLLLLLGVVTPSASGRTGPFIVGADVSWVPEDEADGATYYDRGERSDPVQILRDHGFNYVRLRVFVNPASPIGYAAGRREAFCDLAHAAAMAKRAKAAGMKLLIDFHYSDNWADPGKQAKPAAWADLHGAELERAVHDYTRSSVAALVAQGTPPDMVQIGNEVTAGMLWPDGRWDHFDVFAALVKAGIAGAREAEPGVVVMLHNDAGRNDAKARWWVENLISRGVAFDVIGLSCYDQREEGDWQRTINDLATRYPDHGLIVAEYSARKRYVNDMVYRAPGGVGLGTFIWEPTRWKEAVFDKDGKNAGERLGPDFTPDDPPPTTRPARRPITAPASRPRPSHGERYDANGFIELYDRMARDYGAEVEGK